MGTLKRIGNNVLTRVLVISFVVSFLIFFFENVQTTYNSYTDLEKEIENNKLQKQIIETQIEEWNRQISCLLYTSPSPRDCDRSRMPSSA